MSAFSDLRAALVADLPGLNISAAWPRTINPPCGYIAPPLSSTWVTRGPNFAEHTVALDLTLFVEHDDPEVSLLALEDMVQYALFNLADWTLTGVEPPGPMTVSGDDSGPEYLGSVIHLSKPVVLGE